MIDLQKGIAAIPAAHPADKLVHRAADLAKACVRFATLCLNLTPPWACYCP